MKARELRRGHVFTFHSVTYVCLVNLWDKESVTNFCVCCPHEDLEEMVTNSTTVVLRLFKDFEVGAQEELVPLTPLEVATNTDG